MEGLRVIYNDDYKVAGLAMEVFNFDGKCSVVTQEVISSSVRVFFTEGEEYDATMIAESTSGKILTWNPDSDWFNEYNSIEEAMRLQKETYIDFWKIPVVFSEEFIQYQ